MSEQQNQISVLAGALVTHQRRFSKMPTEDRQWAIQNTEEAIGLFAEAVKNRNGKATEMKETDVIIRIDRLIRPTYPDWADPEWVNGDDFVALERTGPAEYSLGSLELWLHDGQKDGKWTKGEKIYEHFESSNMLPTCLGLADLLAIQELGVEAFRQRFGDRAVFGWRAVVRDRVGYLDVPCLVQDDDKVLLYWCWLVYDWVGDNPALRFAGS